MNKEVKSAIILTISIIIILLVTYFTTAFFLTGEINIGKNNKEEEKSKKTENKILPYDNMILAEDTFKMPYNKYKVLFFTEKESKDELKNAILSFENDKNKLFIVNTDEVINKFVISTEENKNAKKYDELKINKDTLILIENGKIISYITDETELLNELK